VNFPVAELNWDVDLMSILIHGEVEVSVEPLQLYVVPVLVVQQTAHGNEELSAGGWTHTCRGGEDVKNKSIVAEQCLQLVQKSSNVRFLPRKWDFLSYLQT